MAGHSFSYSGREKNKRRRRRKTKSQTKSSYEKNKIDLIMIGMKFFYIIKSKGMLTIDLATYIVGFFFFFLVD